MLGAGVQTTMNIRFRVYQEAQIDGNINFDIIPFINDRKGESVTFSF